MRRAIFIHHNQEATPTAPTARSSRAKSPGRRAQACSRAARLSVAPVGLGVVLLPDSAARRADLRCAVVLLAQATVLLGGRGGGDLAVLHGGLADPVDAGVVADGIVHGVHQDHLVVLVGGVLAHPVGVEHVQVAASLGHAVLGGVAQGVRVLVLVDTLALGVGPLAATTAHAHAVDAVTLLRLVAHAARL